MKQQYLYIFLIIGFLVLTLPAEAQSQTTQSNTIETTIDGLSIYPNPASADRIYITTKKNFSKKIEIYNVLGKRVHVTVLSGSEMNISFLTSGVYMLKIEEAGNTATRKLIIK